MKKKLLSLSLVLGAILIATPIYAENSNPPERGDISKRSVGAALLSTIIWPGIGQGVNKASKRKVVSHAILGIIPPVRLVSGYDALFDRKGGYWNGRI